MARERWTLALILVCLPILATVITAFRVRDLPKSIESAEHKFSQKNSDKTESARRYEELKKAVREKQRLINQKAAETKPVIKIDSDSDDDEDDDDDVGILAGIFGASTKSAPKLNKVEKLSNPIKSKLTKQDDNDNDDDNDDDDDDDDDNDDDDDDDDRGKRKISIKVTEAKKKIDEKSKHEPKVDVKTKEKLLKSATSNEDDDDNDDDDDEDDNDNFTKKSIKIDDKNKAKNIQSSTKTENIKKTVVKDKKHFDSDDDESDNEDDDDDDDDEENVSIKKSVKTEIPKKSVTVEKFPPKEDKVQVTKLDGRKQDVKPKDSTSQLKPKPPVSNPDDSKRPVVSKDSKPSGPKSISAEITPKKLELKEKSLTNLPTKKEQSEPKVKVEVPKISPIKEESKKHKVPEKDLPKHDTKPKTEDVKKNEKKPTQPPKEAKSDKCKGKDSKESSETGHKKEKNESKKENNKPPDSQESGSHMEQLTDMLHRRNMLQSEFEDFYAFLPTFAPNFSRIHNPECRRHGQILLRQLRGTKLWALNMLDASAKIPSGILKGNGIQLGDFDQCLGSRARVQLETGSVVKVQGKYCLARLDVKAEHQELELPVHLAQAKNLIRSRIDDPGHFVPRFSTLSWGVCVPSPCSPEDAEVVIKDSLKHYQHTSGLVVRVKVDERDCHIQDDEWDEWLELPTVLTLVFYGIVVLLVLVATIQDYLSSRKTDESQTEDADEKAECDQKEAEEEEKVEEESKKSADGFLISFSLYRTLSKLTAPGSEDEITCIHGIRGISAIALLVAHKFIPVAVTPYNNRVKITELVSSPLWSWCRAGWVFTDCFLLLSGALTAHRISDGAGAPRRLLSRYLRLTPALLAVVLFYAFIWDHISSGPMWGTLVTKNAEVCQEGWWWNLLYVQNWFGFEDMCAPQTHQLALDMQLTIFGGMLVWAAQVKPGLSKLLLSSIIVLAAYSRYSTVAEHRLTMLAYHGVSVSQLYRTARLSYTSVYHRCTPYLVGLSLGLALQKPAQLNKILLILGWLSSAALWGLVWWAGAESGYPQYRYNASFAAQYAALAPIAAAMATAWVIYAVHNGHSEFLSNFLCCRPLVFISRLSYALYLCQFVVFLTNAATVRTTSEFSLMSLIDLQEISLIILSSTILTITFVIPMQSLHKVFSFSSSSNKEEEKEESEEKQVEDDQSNDKNDPQEDHEEEIDIPQVKSRQILVAHREVLEEIPEVEIEYEAQREKNEGLEEILEEEEEEAEDDEVRENHLDDDDLEVIEEEQGGEDDFWGDRNEDIVPRRSYPVDDDDEDIDEWEWTANGSRNGAQHYRYTR